MSDDMMTGVVPFDIDAYERGISDRMRLYSEREAAKAAEAFKVQAEVAASTQTYIRTLRLHPAD